MKVRPESLIIAPTNDPLVLGVALVDFNHLVRFCSSILLILSTILDLQVGPRIGYSRGKIFEDSFLSLPSLMAFIWYAYRVISHNILNILYLERRRHPGHPPTSGRQCIRHFVTRAWWFSWDRPLIFFESYDQTVR